MNFMMFALWTTVMCLRPCSLERSKAMRQMRSVPSRVMILIDSAACLPTMCSTPA